MEGTRQKARQKKRTKKRHSVELVMQVQSSMALIDITLKNMSMTLYDGRDWTDGRAKKAA